MECFRCFKDMTPPHGTPSLGLHIGLDYQGAQSAYSPENLSLYQEYTERQFGCYKPQVIRLCAECTLRMFGTVTQ